MGREDGGLGSNPVPDFAQPLHDEVPCRLLPRAGQVAYVLQHHHRRALGLKDGKHVLEERPAVLRDAKLATGLAERLTWEPASQHRVLWNLLGLSSELANVLLRLQVPVVLVDRCWLRINLACLDSSTTQATKSSVKAADTGKIVNEIEHEGKLRGATDTYDQARCIGVDRR